MKKVLLSLAILHASFQEAKSQTKIQDTTPVYKMVTIPYYDEYGNLYGIEKVYKHKPTRRDSLDFRVESRREIYKMMDSVKKVNHLN